MLPAAVPLSPLLLAENRSVFAPRLLNFPTRSGPVTSNVPYIDQSAMLDSFEVMFHQGDGARYMYLCRMENYFLLLRDMLKVRCGVYLTTVPVLDL